MPTITVNCFDPRHSQHDEAMDIDSNDAGVDVTEFFESEDIEVDFEEFREWLGEQ
jgi:hypothetical protein